DAGWLAELARTLVEERLAACGNVVDGVRSVYRWEGAVEDEREALVTLHTRRSLVPEVVARVAALHPYDTPQVLAHAVVGADPRYRAWVLAETRTPDAGS